MLPASPSPASGLSSQHPRDLILPLIWGCPVPHCSQTLGLGGKGGGVVPWVAALDTAWQCRIVGNRCLAPSLCTNTQSVPGPEAHVQARKSSGLADITPSMHPAHPCLLHKCAKGGEGVSHCFLDGFGGCVLRKPGSSCAILVSIEDPSGDPGEPVTYAKPSPQS